MNNHMIRNLTINDLTQLLIIENSTQSFPWTEEVFMQCWRAGYLGWGVEKEGSIVGFIITTQESHENHILNLCVHPQFQRQGIATILVKHVLTFAKNQGAAMSFLEVRRSNSHAIALYSKLGFVQISERKNYYPAVTGREDALIFAKDLRL